MRECYLLLREVDEIVQHLTDKLYLLITREEALNLWEEFSDEVYSAGSLVFDSRYFEEFKKWLGSDRGKIMMKVERIL